MISANKYDLIRRLLVTEKSTVLGELGKYIFEVEKTAEKGLIKKAIEEIFTVQVKSVNVLNQKGKQKRFKGVMGRRSDVKKAMVTLEKDYTIDFTGGGKQWL